MGDVKYPTDIYAMLVYFKPPYLSVDHHPQPTCKLDFKKWETKYSQVDSRFVIIDNLY